MTGESAEEENAFQVCALNGAQLRARALAQHRIDDLAEVPGALLAAPELGCFEPDEMFKSTRQVMANARAIRSAVLDERAPLEDALP